jgi:hypothetical protein
LFLTHAVLLLCEAKKSRMIDWTLLAYDKHNAEGRRMGRGLDHFVTDGAKLEPRGYANTAVNCGAYVAWHETFSATPLRVEQSIISREATQPNSRQ